MLRSILALIPIVFAFPNVEVNRAGVGAYRIEARGGHELISRCFESGIEVRYRYRLHYCRRRVGWYDDCGIERTEVRTVRFDPLAETYVVTIDRFGDDRDPQKISVTSAEEARRKVSAIESFPLSFLTSAPGAADAPDHYIGVRSIVDCKREASDVLLDIPYLLSLGLIKTNRFDSGWIAFELDGSGG